MPRLQTATVESPAIQFVASPALDMMNAMFFTSLVPELEGVEGWPQQVRREMAPELLAELDELYNYPAAEPGLMGILGDNLLAHPELWRDVGLLIDHVRNMPLEQGDMEASPGVQGLIYQAVFRYPDDIDRAQYARLEPREAIRQRMESLGDRDAGAVLAIYDRPEELRARMVSLIERFYNEHYRGQMAQRLPALERSASAHRYDTGVEPGQLEAKLTGRKSTLGEGFCAGPFRQLVFAPSQDMGVYSSCSIAGDIHGLFYPCEPEFMGTAPEEAEETRLARIYRALSDEQRLRILRMLREREMYAQEIVERTGLHQSVVSRHLSFMKAVGLVQARRQNNMKFFSLNPEVREMLVGTLTLFETAVRG